MATADRLATPTPSRCGRHRLTCPPPKVGDKSLSFSWSGEPGQTFLLQMARDSAFTQGLLVVNTPEPQAQVPRPEQGGRWWVRTQATDADGHVGPFSAPQMLQLPPCLMDSQGECLQAGDGSTVRGRP